MDHNQEAYTEHICKFSKPNNCFKMTEENGKEKTIVSFRLQENLIALMDFFCIHNSVLMAIKPPISLSRKGRKTVINTLSQ